MKKLKNSVKAIIISGVAVVCTLAIVLGCVFGIKNKDDKNSDPDSSKQAAYAFTEAQKSLANEIILNNEKSKTSYQVLEDVPFSDTGVDKLQSVGENNFTYIDNNRNIDLKLYEKGEESFEYKQLLETFPFDAGLTKTFVNNSGYAMMVNSSRGKYTIRIIYITDFENPVKIFEVTAPNGHVINSELIFFNDNYFGYVDFYDYAGFIDDAWYNVYMYPLREMEYTQEEIANKNHVIETSTKISQNMIYNDNYIADISESGLYVLSCSNGTIRKDEFEYENPYGKLMELVELNGNKFLVSIGERLSSGDLEGNYVNNSETKENYKYSYDLISVDEKNTTKINVSLDGYAHISSRAGSLIGLSTSYVLYRQKVDENHNLTNEIKCSYYDEDNNLILEYNTNDIDEFIMYAGTKTYLTNHRIISTKQNTSAENIYEFVDEIVDDKYELYDTSICNRVFPVRINGGRYGLMDIEGNLVSNPMEFSFRPLLIADHYAIGYHEEEKPITSEINGEPLSDVEIVRTYGKFDFTTKTFSELNLETDEDFMTLLENGFDGYFVKDNEGKTYNLKSGTGANIVDGQFEQVKIYSVSNGAIIQLDDKYVLVNSSNVMDFSTKSSGAQGISSFSYEEVDNTASVQPYYNIPDSVKVIAYCVYENTVYKHSEGGSYKYFYIAPISKGHYFSKLRVNYSWISKYWTIITAKDQRYFTYTSDTSAWFPAMSYYDSVGNISFNYNYKDDKNIYARFAIDCSNDKKLSINSLTDYTIEYAKFKIALDKNGGSGGLTAIYEWDNWGFSSSLTEFKEIPRSDLVATRLGYDFLGYSEDKQGTHIMIGSTGINYSLENKYHSNYPSNEIYATWYAQWLPHKYNVEFDGRGGTLNTANKEGVAYNEIFYVSAPTRLGYTFTGWHIMDMSLTGKLYGSSNANIKFAEGNGQADVLSYKYFAQLNYNNDSTVTFIATWKANTYNVAVEYYEGCSSNKTIKATYDVGFTVSTSVTRTGYTFAGWTLSSLGTNSGLTKYYGTSDSNKQSIASNISATSIGVYSYFLNLAANSNATVKMVARWTANKYKTKFVYGGDTADKTTIQTFNAIFQEPNPTRVGYTFTGWYIVGMSTGLLKKYGSTNAEATAGTYSIPSSISATTVGTNAIYFSSLNTGQNSNDPTVTVTFTAQWTEHTYNLSYNLDGGTLANQPSSARFEETVNISTPTKTGYIFKFWTVSGMTTGHQKYYGNTSGVQNVWGKNVTAADAVFNYFKNLNCDDGGTITLQAKWTPITYNISYVLGENGESGDSAPIVAVYDTPFVVSNPTRRGYTFTGWTVTGMNSGVTHTLGSNTTTATSYTTNASTTSFKNLTSISSATVTFTALWNSITYYISYTWNSGTSGANAPTSAKYDQTVNISNPTRIGYTFTGWEITNMDSSTHTIGSTTTSAISISNVKDTSFKNLTSIANDTVNFNAHWQPIDYKISYNFDGGAAGSGTFPATATFNSAFYVDNPGINRLGYHFVGWDVVNATDAAIKFYGMTAATGTSVAASQTSFSVSLDSNTYSGMYFRNLQTSTVEVVTLTAKWEANVYNIDYDLRDPKGREGSIVSTAPKTVKYEDVFTIPNPSIAGYSFVGWSLRDLSDDCVHYFNSSPFNSTNGSYVNPNNPGELMILNSTSNAFKNLHCEQGATVQLVANWRANSYTITYHYMPNTIDTSTLNSNTLNLVGNMTETRSITVTYDQYFTLLKATNTTGDTSGIELPMDVRLIYWVFYQSAISDSNKSLATTTNDPVPVDRPYFAQGSEQCYCADNTAGGIWGGNSHVYAVYSFVEIELQYYGTSLNDDINDISKYSYAEMKSMVRTYSPVTLPATLRGLKVAGYMISSNRIDAGFLSNGSITTMTVTGTKYTAKAGVEVYWGYSSKLAYDLDHPVFYLYAVYEVDTYTVSFSPNIPAASNYEPSGSIPTITILSGNTATLPRAGDVSLNLIGYTLSSYTLTDMASQTFTLSPGATLNPESYDVYKDFTLKVNFSPNTYSIIYELNGGTKSSGKSYPDSANFDEWVQVSVPTKTGYTLTRWYVTDCTTIQTRYYGSSTTDYSVTTNTNNTISRSGTVTSDYYYKNLNCDESGSVKFVAVWTPITYHVKIDLGDGSPVLVLAVNYDEWIDIPYIQRNGYQFKSMTVQNLGLNIHYFEDINGESTRIVGMTPPGGGRELDTYYVRALNLTYTKSTVNITINWEEVAAASYSVKYCASEPQDFMLPNVSCDAIKFW